MTPEGWFTRGRLILWTILALLLMLPGLAMLFTPEVNWGPEDFLVAALLLGMTGIGIERAQRLRRWRVVAGSGVVGVALIIWLELAVGLFGPG